MALSKILPAGQSQFAGARNLIINGAMQVAQRGTSAVAAGDPNYPSLDRFKAWEGTDGAYTVEQSTDAPTGFSKSLKAQVTTEDTSLAAGQYAQIVQNIEAQDLQHLDYGLSTAKTLTLSFWVKSSKTGTYCITAYKEDTTGSAVTLLFPKEYTISSANTWEQKTITIAPDSQIKAATGAIDDDNGVGIGIYWNLAQGSTYTGGTDATWSSNTNHFATTNQVNWMDSTSNDFYLTGVQLEVGSATPFEHRSFGDELARCQRYFQIVGDYRTLHLASRWNSTQLFATYPLAVPLRAGSTQSTGGTFPVCRNYSNSQSGTATAIQSSVGVTLNSYNSEIMLVWIVPFTPTSSNTYQVYADHSGDYVLLDADL